MMDDADYVDIGRRAKPEQTAPIPPSPPPEIEAMQQMLSEAFHREMILRTELVRVRRSATQAMAMQREE